MMQPARAVLIAALLAALPSARAGERDRLNACQALVGRTQNPGAAATAPDQAELSLCRQIIKEWTLRDSRMSVDEQGRKLR